MKKVLLTVSAFTCALTGLVAVACDKTEKINYRFDTLCTEVSVQDVTVNKGEEFTLPTPEPRGKEWEFAGWYLTSDFSDSPVTSVSAEADATYYAKWERKYKINLQLDGGTLDGADDVYLKAGESVSSRLESCVPSKGVDYQFGKWLNGTSDIGNLKMPSEDLTLTAKYKIAYKVDLYTQNLDALLKGETDQFDKETVTHYEYAGKTVDYSKTSSAYRLKGFNETVHEGAELTGEISENPRENDDLFSIYFNRKTCTVWLDPNVEGTTQQAVSKTFYYGQEYEGLAETYGLFKNVGYVFGGWSKNPSGENDYPIDYIDAVLYNKTADDESEIVMEKKYIVEEDATLHAYWKKGYSDLFGGADTIFLLDDASEEIYLLRGDKYFKGEYRPSDRIFTFWDKDGENDLFHGKILNGERFCYASDSRMETDAMLYSYASGANKDIRLQLDEYNGARYIEKGNLSVTANGSYRIDEKTGEYVVSFDSGEGEMVGKTIRCIIGTVNGVSAFIIRNEQEYAYGMLHRIGVYNDKITPITADAYSLTLDGYGNALYYNGTTKEYYYYCFDEEYGAFRLFEADGSLFGYARYYDKDGLEGYTFYTPAFDDTLLNAQGKDETLTLDGVMNVTYKVGNTVVAKGLYSMTTSYFGGNILTFRGGGKDYTFRLNMELGGTLFNPVITYTFEEKPEGYLEYYYYGGKNDKGSDVYNYPVLVLNDEEAGKANLYASIDGTLTKAASGSYVSDEKSGYYLYTIEWRDESILSYAGNKLDLNDISSFIFALDTENATRRMYYVYSQKDNADPANETFNTVEYSPSKTEQEGMKLTIVGGMAIFTEQNDANTIIASYRTINRNGVDITVILSSPVVYLELNETYKTFIKYEESPYTAYVYREDGTRYLYETLESDGKGGYKYSFRETASDENSTVTYTGTVSDEGKTTGNAPIMRFTETLEGEGEAFTFRFILVTDGQNLYFSKISDKEGSFKSNDGILELDGTGFTLKYTDTFNRIYQGVYRARTDNVIYTYLGGSSYLYFELDAANKTFRFLGSEYGTYLLLKNRIPDGRALEFDGKGGVKIYDTESGVESAVTGTYVVADDGLITVTYGSQEPLIGRLGTLEIDGMTLATFSLHYDQVAETYVNEADYSVLVLNDTGSAIRFTQNGGVERGTYMLITSEYNILYYVNDAGTFATIYSYDPQTGIIVDANNKRLSYFNESFVSLLFTEYGYAIFNGVDRYYYYIDDNDVAIYRIAKEGDAAEDINEYGFVKDVLAGGFQNKIEYNGVDYYKNEGTAIKFSRNESEALEYPAPGRDDLKLYLTDLYFNPTGRPEFSVSGTVKLSYEEEGKTVTQDEKCTVERRVKEGTSGATTEYETYVLLGSYRYDIVLTLKYNAQTQVEGSTYSVTRMRYYLEAESYNYLNHLQMALAMGGSVSQVPYYGKVTIWQDYDKEGVADEVNGMRMSFDVNPEYAEYLKLVDANGEVISSVTNQPCVINSSLMGSSATVTFTNTVYTDEQNVKHGDGHTYKCVFAFESRKFGVLTFQMSAFYREQTLTDTAEGKNYSVTVGRVVASETSNSARGNLYSLTLTDNSGETATEIEASDILKIREVWHVIVRSEGAEPVYYRIDLNDGSTSTEITDVLPYQSVTVTKMETVKTIYTKDNKSFVDINEAKDEIMVFKVGQTYHYVKETEHAAGSNVYTVTTTAGSKFTVTVTEEEGVKTAEIVEIATAESQS